MKVKFANGTLETKVYIVIKDRQIIDVRQDVSDYENESVDIFPIDCRGEVTLDVSNVWYLREHDCVVC